MFALLASLAATALAPTPTPTPTPTKSPDSEVITVTASPLGDASDALGQGVAVVVREEALGGALSGGIGEALAGVAGVRATSYGPNASRPIIRGLGEDRIRLLLNGLAGIDASTISPDHAPAIDGLDADQIEVLKGPAALRFGSNAIGGVVNVVDGRLPTQLPEQGVSGDVFVGGSSVAQAKAGAFRLRATTDAYVFALDGLARSNDDYAINGFAQTEALRAQTGDETRDSVFNTRGEIWAIGASAARITDRGSLGLSVRNTRSNYGIPGEEAAIDLQQTRVDGRLTRKDVGLVDTLSLAATTGDYSHSEIGFDGSVGTVFTNQGYEARLEGRLKPMGRWDGLIGAQFGSVDVATQGEEAFILPVTVRQSGIFAFERYAQDHWGGEMGVRGEQRRYRGEAGARDFDLISGSASAFVKPVPSMRLSLSLAKTERAPTEVELFANGPHAATQAFEIGNSALAKEVATSFEWGMSWRMNGWRAHVDVWQAEFDGFIGFAPNGEEADGLAIYEVSQKDAILRGHEFGLSGPLWVGARAQVSADLSGDYVRGREKGGAFIARMPPPQVTFGLVAQWATFKARVEAQKLDTQKKLAAFETPTSGATIYNLRLSWRPLGDGDGIELALEGSNLTDELVREHSSFLKDSVPKPSRSLKLSLHAKF